MKIVVKGYQVATQLERTGLRTLYRATHLASGKEMFLTVIAVRPGRSLNNLVRRAQQSRRLTLSGLVPAVDFGVLADDRFFYTHQAMASYPVHHTLTSINDSEEKLYSTVYYLINALELLDYLHEAGTTHRDLNSNQIRIDRSGQVLLEGYINARPKVEARNLIKIVNMPYMSPEQLSSVQSADPKTDIYSIGCILFELLTGEVPYDSNFKKVEDARQGIVPIPSQFCEVASELDAICVRSMAQRNSRYSHVRQMIADLENFHRKRSMRHKIREFSSLLRGILPSRRS